MKYFFNRLSWVIIYGLYIGLLLFVLYIGISVGEQNQVDNSLIKKGYSTRLTISSNNKKTFCRCRK